MSIKPPPSFDLMHPLADGSVMRLSGRDAFAFTQAQFANDVALLAVGQWQWSLLLSPKGRVIALFALIRLADDEFLVWLPDFPAASLAEHLVRVRFRSKVDIETLENAGLFGSFTAPDELGFDALQNRASILRDAKSTAPARIVLDLTGATPRTLMIDLQTSAPSTDSDFVDARWRLDDIAHGLPRLGDSQVEAFTPQMLGLERLHAFSVKKGCYPGQEIVARTHFLGKAKRSSLRMELNQLADPGTRFTSSTGAHTDLVCIAEADSRIEALAVGPLGTDEHFRSDDGTHNATPLPWLDGLAR